MSDLKVNSILDRSGGDNVSINGVVIRPGVLDNENRIINGAFDFWQRGTSFTGGEYGADRWVNIVSGGTVTMSRQSFTFGEKLGKNNPRYFLRQSSTGQSLSSHYANITQRVEDVRSYAGETITILGWIRRSSGAGNAVADVFQYFGTGGSPSSTVFTPAVTIPLTTNWEPFAATVTLPSVTGKLVGTNNNDYLGVRLWISAGSDYDSGTNSLGLQTIGVDFWGIHIRRGTHPASAALDYVQPELGPELLRCQRYYEVGTFYEVVGVSNTSIIASVYTYVRFCVTKRIAPTVTGTSNEGTFSPAGITAERVGLGRSNAVANRINSGTFIADAEI